MRKGGATGRGAKKKFKGQRRVFSNPEEIQKQNEEERKKQEWREKTGDVDEDAEDAKKNSGSSESESESSDDEGTAKNKGVSHLIQIENPNRVVSKSRKAKDVDLEKPTGTALTRREREEIQKQQAQTNYREMHAQGKTDEAMKDLARLSVIRKQREDAAKKREDEKKAKEAATAAATKKGKS